MSYTPDDQKIVPAIEKIQEGIREYAAVAMERVKYSENWDSSGLRKTVEMQSQLATLNLDLEVLKQGDV